MTDHPIPDTYTITLDARYVDAWLAQHRGETAEQYDRWAEEAAHNRSNALSYHLRAQLLRQVPRPLVVGHLARRVGPVEVLVLCVGETRVFTRRADGTETSWPIDLLTYSRPAPEGWPHHEEADDDR